MICFHTFDKANLKSIQRYGLLQPVHLKTLGYKITTPEYIRQFAEIGVYYGYIDRLNCLYLSGIAHCNYLKNNRGKLLGAFELDEKKCHIGSTVFYDECLRDFLLTAREDAAIKYFKSLQPIKEDSCSSIIKTRINSFDTEIIAPYSGIPFKGVYGWS